MKPKTHADFYRLFQAFGIQVRDGHTFETEEQVKECMQELEASAKRLQIPFVLDHERYLNAWRSVEESEDEDASSSEEESSSSLYGSDDEDEDSDED